jgi:hypothetical protein
VPNIIYAANSGAAQKTIATPLTTAISTTATAWNSSQDVNATVAGLTISLPAFTIADLGKTMLLSNMGINPYTVALTGGTLNSAVGLVMNPSSIWTFEAQTLTTANVTATNAAQQIAADTGTVALTSNTSLTAAAISVSTAINAPGLSFTAQETATYIVNLKLHSNQTAANQNLTAALYNTLTPTVAVVNSETLVATPGATGQYSGSGSFVLNATAGSTYQIKFFSTAGVATAALLDNTNGRSTLTWQKVSGASVSSIAGAAPGDIKFSGLTADHGGNWILLDGRLKSALTAAQQAVATSLGYGTNIPDMRGRMAVGAGGTLAAVLNGVGGSLSIAQNNLPNVTLGGSTTTDPGHAHTAGSLAPIYNYQNFIAAGGSGATGSSFTANSGAGGGSYTGAMNAGTTATGGSHSHPITTNSINGNVTQQNFISPYFANNWFVWLGSSANTVTTVQPLSLTTTGTGLSTFNPATGVLNIPANNTTCAVVTAINTSGQSILGSTTTQITGWTIQKDTSGSFTAGGVFTAPRTADYQVSFNVAYAQFTSSVNGGATAQITGAVSRVNAVSITPNTLEPAPQVNAIISLTAGQTISFATFQNSGATRVLNTANDRVFLSIAEINPSY